MVAYCNHHELDACRTGCAKPSHFLPLSFSFHWTGVSGDKMKEWIQEDLLRRHASQTQGPMVLPLKMFGPGDEVRYGDTWLWSLLKMYHLHVRWIQADDPPPIHDVCHCLPAWAFMPSGCKHCMASDPPVVNITSCGACSQCLRCGGQFVCIHAWVGLHE